MYVGKRTTVFLSVIVVIQFRVIALQYSSPVCHTRMGVFCAASKFTISEVSRNFSSPDIISEDVRGLIDSISMASHYSTGVPGPPVPDAISF